MEAGEPGAVRALLSSAISRLMPLPFEPLIGPPEGKAIKATGSLIGLGPEAVDPCAPYEQNLAAVKALGVPRFRLLTPVERKHETSLAPRSWRTTKSSTRWCSSPTR
jgi:hypothetical protein